MNQNPTPAKASSFGPWGWIPSVYIAEGLPYFAVNVLTVIMYTNMGIPPTEMAFYTGLLYLPWVIKPFWSPFVDLIKTKRWWTLGMQLLIAVAMASVAIAITSKAYFFISLVFFWIMAFCSATHDIAADGFYMLALDEKQQAAYVGIRSTFYRIASILGQGLIVMFAGYLEIKYAEVSTAWSATFILLSAVFLLIFLWDRFALPRPAADKPRTDISHQVLLKEFVFTFFTFFRKKHIWLALTFILLYRLPEAMCLKLVSPFLLDSIENGGLGLSTAQVGFANGTVGVVALLAGGIVGGLLIARGGLKRWLWPMALSLTLPCLVYCLFALYQPSNLFWISVGLGIEQFGYGFGFTAYMLYLMYFSAGESQTSHYAFCTAFMALGMMIPGMAAGWIFDFFNKFDNVGTLSAGYLFFFSFIMITSIATFVAVSVIKPTIKED